MLRGPDQAFAAGVGCGGRGRLALGGLRLGLRGGLRAGGDRLRASLAEGRGLADPVTQEVQLGAADLAVADDFDLLDARAVDLEGPLHADAAGDPADRDRAGDPAAAEAHEDAFEDLDPLSRALDDLRAHPHGVARGEDRQVGAQLVGDDLVEYVHAAIPSWLRRSVLRFSRRLEYRGDCLRPAGV